MATKKSGVEKTVKPEAVEEAKAPEIEEEAKAPEIEEEAKAPEIEEVETDVVEKEEERVMVMIPFIPGQDPEETVIINGNITKIKRGEQVWVTRPVASVLENSYQAQRIAMVNREKLKSQRTDL